MNSDLEQKAKSILAKDTENIPLFWQNKYRTDAAKNWDLFYKRNTTKFFKDRHWIGREFEELNETTKQKKVLELGCGVGNFIFPVLEANPSLFIYACDFSKRAIEFVKSHPQYDESRCNAFVVDLTKDDLVQHIEPETIDLVSAIFVFSAIPPEKHADTLRNIKKVSNLDLARNLDYGIYDAAQLKFSSAKNHKLEENLYIRQDGTMSYFFSIEYLKTLFESEGFKTISAEFIQRETTNQAKHLSVDRLFVQAKFHKVQTGSNEDSDDAKTNGKESSDGFG
ncbi:2008_t:CDS:2 [Paraglomus occultum]|uniref:tRNA N(3)-methylcytidine methyltransferase n=1 Tax=Paraglomus occultum TaxID=144539 RepID=A0A9N8WAX9_9GLOM|nr:2008_t:CDS:2 [Paraglomus occultum]